jgi:cytochrome c biogenesis protein CcdA
MVATILPIVNGQRQLDKRFTALRAHAVGCLVGGALIGAALGVAGAIVPLEKLPLQRPVLVALVTGSLSLLYSFSEAALIRLPASQCRWQVPLGWRDRLPHNVSSLSYGLGLGLAVATRIPVATIYALIVWSLMVGTPALASFVMLTFGLGRVLPLWLMIRVLKTHDQSARCANSLHRLTKVVHLVNGFALAGVGSYLLFGAISK